MTNEQALAQKYFDALKRLVEVAQKAHRHDQSLKGNGFYAEKFHDGLVELAPLERPFLQLLQARAASVAAEVTNISAAIKSNETRGGKAEALKKLQLYFGGTVLPAFGEQPEEPASASEAVLPMQVIKGTRGYLENIVTQANVCYEHRCFDACAVMIRKLVELLIIQVFEQTGKAAEIKHPVSGDYLRLGDLVTKILGHASITLSRNTKKALPEIKDLGDRSAHMRHYMAKRVDVDKVLSGLRVSVEDLLHLGGLR